jgi:hypothetical protein
MFYIAGLGKPSPKSRKTTVFQTHAAEETDHWHRRLLRVRRARLYDRQPANEKNEIAPSHKRPLG